MTTAAAADIPSSFKEKKIKMTEKKGKKREKKTCAQKCNEWQTAEKVGTTKNERNERKKLARACILEDGTAQECSSSAASSMMLALASTNVDFNDDLSKKCLSDEEVTPLFTILEEEDSECCANVKIMGCDHARALAITEESTEETAKMIFATCCSSPPLLLLKKTKSRTKKKKSSSEQPPPPLPMVVTIIAATDDTNANDGNEGIDVEAANTPDTVPSGICCLDGSNDATITHDTPTSGAEGEKSISSGRTMKRIRSRPYEQIENNNCRVRLKSDDDVSTPVSPKVMIRQERRRNSRQSHVTTTTTSTASSSIEKQDFIKINDNNLYSKQDHPSNFDMNHASRQRLQKQSNNNISWDELTSELEECKLISIVDLNRNVHSNNDFGLYYQQGKNHANTSHQHQEDHKNTSSRDNDVSWDELNDAINKGCMKSLLDVSLQVVQTQQQLEPVQNGTLQISRSNKSSYDSWQCLKCTYMNENATLLSCEVCNTSRYLS